MSRNELSDEARISLALGAMAHFQSNSQQADGKASILIAVHAGGLAVLISCLTSGPGEPSAAVPSTAWGLLALFAATAGMAAFCLAQVVRARLTSPSADNHFSFPDVSRHGVGTPDPSRSDDLIDEIWAVAEIVAGIAVIKNRYLNRALWSLTAMLLTEGLLLMTI